MNLKEVSIECKVLKGMIAEIQAKIELLKQQSSDTKDETLLSKISEKAEKLEVEMLDILNKVSDLIGEVSIYLHD